MYKIQNFSLDNHLSRYLHINNHEKPAIIVLPGNLQEIESIQLFNNGLSIDFDYYALELPGMGLTKPLHPSFSISYLADLLTSFIKNKIKKPAYLLAVSYATPIALEAAKCNPWISRLALAGSMKDSPVEDWGGIFALLSNSLKDRSTFSTLFIDSLTTDDKSIPRQRAVKKAAKIKASKYTDDQFWCFINNSLRLLVYKPVELEKIKCPTLCFTGEKDPYVTVSRSRELANLIPNSHFDTIENTDHLFMIEKPDDTVKLVRDFF